MNFGVVAIVSLLLLSTAPPGGGRLGVHIGYCGAISQIKEARSAGFDYVELRTVEVVGLSDTEFARLMEQVKAIGIPVEASYQFLPPGLKITGPHIDKQAQMNYVRKAFDRVSRLGVNVVVLGSGDARRFPQGFSKDEAFGQLVDFCKRIGPEARARNITIAIEPQRREESNIINSVAEGLKLVEAADDPNIQLTVDFYHLEMEKEDPAIILKAKDHVRHVQIANPTERVFPLNAEEYNYAPFFSDLRKIGYSGGISIEAKSDDFEKDAPHAIAFLREAFSTLVP